eukprot:jgi/Chlat1/4515/Chrsp29S04444
MQEEGNALSPAETASFAPANHQAALLPESLRRFLEAQGVDVALYDLNNGRPPPRHTRLKPGTTPETLQFQQLLSDTRLVALGWLPGFYVLKRGGDDGEVGCDGEIGIARLPAYKQGLIYGMDAASGAAVTALDVRPGDNVLDLCAAPGAKLCMLADCLSPSQAAADNLNTGAIASAGTVTAVDIAPRRLAACRTMLKKYRLSNCFLVLADGTKFQPEKVCTGNKSKSDVGGAVVTTQQQHDKLSKRARGRLKDKAKKDLLRRFALDQQTPQLFYGPQAITAVLPHSFNKVLVDAECSNDGSIKHILMNEGFIREHADLFSPERLAALRTLQRGLIANGFRLLRPGGTLVYSTCSLTRAQNEDIVQWLLDTRTDASLEAVPNAAHWPCRQGDIAHTLRFDPLTSRTGGLFIARVRKRAS